MNEVDRDDDREVKRDEREEAKHEFRAGSPAQNVSSISLEEAVKTMDVVGY
jgi:hypothetical protein